MEADKGEKNPRERRIPRKNEQAVGTAASEPRRGPKSCSSHYKGVTKHRRTGRWEAHIWGRSINKGPGKQIYLGGFVTPEEAAEAHDLAALQLQGPNAKTNFHISKYAEWLATLQATPSEDNLPLQLRRAGMFKRCTDRAKQQPGFGPSGHFQGEPNTPLNAEVKARLSRASDSTQTAEVTTNNMAYFEREESVNSQSSGQGVAQQGAIRRPMPMRLGMPMGTSEGRNGAEDHQIDPPRGQNEIPAATQPQRQASGSGPQILPSRDVLSGQGQSPATTAAPFLNSRVVPQLVPLGWKSFQALAEEQAAAAAAQQASEGAGFGGAMQIAPILSTAALPPQFFQMPPEGPSFMNTSANGGIVYGHKHYLGFLSPEQVRWLEASGVKFPEHLRASSPPHSIPGSSMVTDNPGLQQGFVIPAEPGFQQPGLFAFSGAAQPFSVAPQPFLPPPQSLMELQQPFLGFQPHLVTSPPPASEPAPVEPAPVAAASPASATPEAAEPQSMDFGEGLPALPAAQSTRTETPQPEQGLVAEGKGGEQAQLAIEQTEERAADGQGLAEAQFEQPGKEGTEAAKPPSLPAEGAAGADQEGGQEQRSPKKSKTSREDKQIVEALLGLRAAK